MTTQPALLTTIPQAAGGQWLNGVRRKFKREHEREPVKVLVRWALPSKLAAAMREAGLCVVVDESIRPGLARLVA